MRTMLTIVFSIFAMTACAVEEPTTLGDDLVKIPQTDLGEAALDGDEMKLPHSELDEQSLEVPRPEYCEQDIDCRQGYSSHTWACDSRTNTCVTLDLPI